MISISYVAFIKNAEKVTKTASASRPVLKGVYHSSDGSLAVTDSHRLYIAKNSHTAGEQLIDPKTGLTIDGNYPDVSRLIPVPSDAKYTVRLNVKQAVDAFKVLLAANKFDNGSKYPTTTAYVTDDAKVMFAVESNEIKVYFTNPFFEGGQGDKMSFNTQYFFDALTLFKDVGVTELIMRYYGSLRPFTLSAGPNDELLALLLPIRTEAN